MRRLGGSVAGAAGTIAILTLLARLVGFVRTWAQNGALGDTLAGEAYSTANTVPNVLFEVAAGGALAGAVIPLVSGFLAKGMREDVDRTASALVTWILAVGLPLAGIVMVTAGPVTRALLGSDTDPAELALAETLLRMFALQVPLYGLSVVLTGVLQAHKRFLLPAVAPMLSSVTVIGGFAVFGHLASGHQNDPAGLSPASVLWLGWGTTFGVVAFALPQLIPVLKLVRLRPRFAFPPGVARRALGLVGAGLGGLAAQQVQIVVVMVVANARGGTGAFPVYTFANAVYMVPYAVLAVPIATAVFPRLSEAAALPGRPGLTELTARSTRLVLDIGMICIALLAVLAVPARIVFDVLRPAVGMDTAMVAMAPGLAGYALIYHGSRVLYAVEASRAVVAVNTLAWLSASACLGVFAASGVEGRRETLITVGVSVSVGMTVGAAGQLLAIRRAVGGRATEGVLRSIAFVGGTTLACGALAWLAARGVLGLLGEGLAGALVALVLAGGIVLAGGAAAILAADRSALRMRGGPPPMIG